MISNYNDFRQKLSELSTNSPKKKLLLHSCCAPCSSHVLTVLASVFDLTIYYDNPNIEPLSEFNRRLDEQIELVKKMGLNIKVINNSYNHQLFLEAIKGKEDLGEKSIRCYSCYELRLKNTYQYAKENNFDYYTTTLSISPHKNSDWINEIGYNNQDEKCQFLYSNFKKESGYLHSIELSKQYNLYRQDYCGCEFSKKEQLDRINK